MLVEIPDPVKERNKKPHTGGGEEGRSRKTLSQSTRVSFPPQRRAASACVHAREQTFIRYNANCSSSAPADADENREEEEARHFCSCKSKKEKQVSSRLIFARI